MVTKTFRRILALALIAAFLRPAGIRASEDVALRPGVRVAVDVSKIGHLVGTIQAVEPGGFILQPESGDEVFVAFGSVLAYRNPDTGMVITLSREAHAARWAKVALISVAVVGGLAIATRGMIPICLFSRCD